MSGIIIDINPIALNLGGFELRWYSLAILAAMAVGLAITLKRAKVKGVDRTLIYNLMPWMLLSGIVGARLFHVFDHWGYYSDYPLQIIQLQNGGLAIWGAVLGVGITMLVYAKLKHIQLGRFMDVVVPGLLAAQIIGRFGCIINGDAYGGITNLPWEFVWYAHSSISSI
jgi:phosphatidylglycerol:prolipoprotein diacylglycerol transferase